MIVTTTNAVEGRPVQKYLGIVTGEAIVQAQAAAIGGNAVIGVDIDYEVLGANGSMLMVSTSGTAVVL